MGKNFKKDIDPKEEKSNGYKGKNSQYRKNGNSSHSRGNSYNKKNFDDKRNYDEATAEFDKRGVNSPEWYAYNQQLLSDSSSLAYSWSVGQKVDISTTWKHGDPTSVPGIMALELVPTIGISNDNTSAVNIAARGTYSFVRHANAGAKNYDSPDLMMYMLSMDSVYSCFSYLMRAYGVISLYNQKNRYVAKALIEAMGIDYESMLYDIANFRYRVNLLAQKVASLYIPNHMSYYLRHIWMYQNIYTDAPTAKSQLMMYVPSYFYKYEGYEDRKGGQLVPFLKYDPTIRKTVDDLCGGLDTMLSALIVDEDINIMSGDMEKAFGSEKRIRLGQIPEDYLVSPIYNEEVLSQFQNATVLSRPITDIAVSASANIHQETNGDIIFNPILRGGPWGQSYSRYFTIRKDIVTPADTMVASRLTVLTDGEADRMWASDTLIPLVSCGSEFVSGMYIFQFQLVANIWQLVSYKIPGCLTADKINEVMPATITEDQLMLLIKLEKFDWHPSVRIFRWAPEQSSGDYLDDFIDLDNYVIIQSEELKKMHDTAILSEFAVPVTK